MNTILPSARTRALLPTAVALALLLVLPVAFFSSNATAVEIDVGVEAEVSGETTVTASSTTQTSIDVKGSVDVTVKAGTTTEHQLTVSNPSGRPVTITLSAAGDAATWVALSRNTITLDAQSSQTVQLTIAPPAETRPGSYTAEINIESTAGAEQAIFVKVNVPQLLFEVSPRVVTVVAQPQSRVEASVLLLNTGSAEISNIQLEATGEAASMIQLSSTTVRLPAQGVAEARLTIDVDAVATGSYWAKVVMTAEDGTTEEVDVEIRVVTVPVQGEVIVTNDQAATLDLAAGAEARATSTISVDATTLAGLGISVQVAPGSQTDVVTHQETRGEIAEVADVSVETTAGADGKLDVAISAEAKAGTRSGIFAGTVILETQSGAKIEVPVVAKVQMQAVAQAALVIDGSDADWTQVTVKASVSDAAGDAEGSDVAVDVVAVRITNTENYVLLSLQVAGDIDSATRLYGVRFETDNDARADYALEFRGNQAVLLDAHGNVVTSVSAIAWAHSSGTLEAAVDQAQFQAVVGSAFTAQAYARGSYDETAWFPRTGAYSLSTGVPAPSSPTAPSAALTSPLVIGLLLAAVAVAAGGLLAYKRRPQHPTPPLSS